MNVYVLHIIYGGDDSGEYRQSIHNTMTGAEGELISAASEYYENVMGKPLPDDREDALQAIDSRVPLEWTIEEYEVQP